MKTLFFLGTFLFVASVCNAQMVELFDDGTEDSADEIINPASESSILDDEQAKDAARDLLQQKPTILNLRKNDLKSLEQLEEKTREIRSKTEKIAQEKEEAEETEEDRIKKLKAKYQSAPFGLYWAASQENIKKFGFELLPAERKDYKNVFQVVNPQQKNNTFAYIIAIFGMQDKLWCVYAQGIPQEDDAKATKVLALYHRYFEALSAKYGNAEEHFEPYTYEERLIKGEGEKKKVITVTKQNPLGGDNFLQELQEGKAVLYATFQNDKIGVTLGVSVDGDGKSYLSVDYKDFALMDSEQQTILNRTIEDL